jgi:hypothetical protein
MVFECKVLVMARHFHQLLADLQKGAILNTTRWDMLQLFVLGQIRTPLPRSHGRILDIAARSPCPALAPTGNRGRAARLASSARHYLVFFFEDPPASAQTFCLASSTSPPLFAGTLHQVLPPIPTSAGRTRTLLPDIAGRASYCYRWLYVGSP